MDPVTEFRRHVSECRNMARATRALEDKAAWNRMAERWQRCAELAESERNAAQTMARARTAKYRRPDRFSRSHDAA
jgi:hypothetical protein